jgi:adenosyl cobinamide kinase/adenosyl cobinamide phosphate guanylyltransferase
MAARFCFPKEGERFFVRRWLIFERFLIFRRIPFADTVCRLRKVEGCRLEWRRRPFPKSMCQIPGNDLDLGYLAGKNTLLRFPRTSRDKHLYVAGGTGTGKSKFLESLIRQDIINWRKSKCAVIVLDPHGNLYDNLVQWLAWHNIDRPIIPIDLRQDDWVVSYNLLRQRQADPAVLVDNITDAMAHVWGADGTNQTPLFARWIGNVLRALYEKKLTLIESQYLIDRVEKQIRYALTGDLKDKPSRQDWMFADTLNAKDFEAQIGSTVNRLQRFIRNKTMQSIFGQPSVSLDLGRVSEEGSIVLVSLATARVKISPDNAKLFATLFLNDLWTAAQERGKRDGVKPAYIYCDEFQRFISPTLAENLDEARGFGLHFTMAHQFPKQLLDQGDSGRRLYNSIMENASSKVVFRLTDRENLEPLAEWLFRGTMNPDEIKHELYSTKVMEYREELRTSYTRGKSTSTGGGEFTGTTASTSAGGITRDDENEDANSWNESEADSSGTSSTWTESETESETESSVLIPAMGKELSNVQFRSLEEQLFRAMAVLFDQQERFSVARLVGMSAPVSLRTPTIQNIPSLPERTKRYLERCYAKLPFAMPGHTAHEQVLNRAEQFGNDLLKEAATEPASAKRKLH